VRGLIEKRITKMILLLGVTIMGIFGCSSESANQFSPEQVINNALDEEIRSYYAEADLITHAAGKEPEKILLKEWVSKDGKRRTETQKEDGSEHNIAVNDGSKLISYEPEKNQAFIVEDEELLALNQTSPKQQAEQLLKIIKDSHEITSKGEIEILERPAYHLLATAKEKNSLIGDQEMWIDKESWMVLKTISQSGDIKVEMAYTKLDFNTEIPADTFVLNLPDDVQIQDLLDGVSEASQLSLREALEKVGTPFFYVGEKSGLEISNIEVLELKGELNRNEVNIDYQKNNLPYFTLTVFQSPEDVEEELGKLPGEKTVNILDKEVTYMEMNDFRSLNWQEEGLNYTILFIDPNLTLEDITPILEEMVLVTEAS